MQHRITPFTNMDLNRSVVARRKNGKVRYFDPVTARMTGWLPDPFADARKPKRSALFDEFMDMRKAELLALTGNLGMKFAQRTTKRELVHALLNA